MAQFSAVIIALALVMSPLGLTSSRAAEDVKAKPKSDKPVRPLSSKERLDFIRRAQVWTPTNVSEMDLRAGPQGPGAVEPGAVVTCDYVKTNRSGSNPKFDCALPDGDIIKVKYGQDNGEVFGAVLGSRLLWALGFGADRVYPARVVCRGCTSDPWVDNKKVNGEHTFGAAIVERKPVGHSVNAERDSGWAWSELGLIDESAGGATRAQVDALRLLAIFIQHTDSKPEQQRLVCLSNSMSEGPCEKPFMAIHDVGLTFGHGNFSNSQDVGSVNFKEWERTPVWRDPAACVAHMSRSHSGTLGDPAISEAGRTFLANLMMQLSDAQIRDLFEVAGVDKRPIDPDSAKPTRTGTVDEWVAAFKHKRDEIVTNHCPS